MRRWPGQEGLRRFLEGHLDKNSPICSVGQSVIAVLSEVWVVGEAVDASGM